MCGLPVALSAIDKAPVTVPGGMLASGVNATVMLQLDDGYRLCDRPCGQSLARMVKLALLVVTERNVTGEFPIFRTVMFSALFQSVVPTTSTLKFVLVGATCRVRVGATAVPENVAVNVAFAPLAYVTGKLNAPLLVPALNGMKLMFT